MGTFASCLVASKSALEVQDALQHFLGVTRPKVIYSDNADDIIREVKDLGFRGRHEFCQPGLPQTNGVAERAVQCVLDGARALMSTQGFLGMLELRRSLSLPSEEHQSYPWTRRRCFR